MANEHKQIGGSLGVIRIELEEEHHEVLSLKRARCTLTKPMKVDDWCRTTTFFTFIKVNDKVSKLIDSESCINVISTKVAKRLSLIPSRPP